MATANPARAYPARRRIGYRRRRRRGARRRRAVIDTHSGGDFHKQKPGRSVAARSTTPVYTYTHYDIYARRQIKTVSLAVSLCFSLPLCVSLRMTYTIRPGLLNKSDFPFSFRTRMCNHNNIIHTSVFVQRRTITTGQSVALAKSLRRGRESQRAAKKSRFESQRELKNLVKVRNSIRRTRKVAGKRSYEHIIGESLACPKARPANCSSSKCTQCVP